MEDHRHRGRNELCPRESNSTAHESFGFRLGPGTCKTTAHNQKRGTLLFVLCHKAPSPSARRRSALHPRPRSLAGWKCISCIHKTLVWYIPLAKMLLQKGKDCAENIHHHDASWNSWSNSWRIHPSTRLSDKQSFLSTTATSAKWGRQVGTGWLQKVAMWFSNGG